MFLTHLVYLIEHYLEKILNDVWLFFFHPVCNPYMIAGNGTIEASVSAGNKMRVMSVLMHRESEIRDLTIREPSLEEVFFGVD